MVVITINAPKDPGVRFPFISLEKALRRAKQLYDDAGEHEVLISDAFKTWEYSNKSSGGFQTIATLKMYGLLDDNGSGEKRRVNLTKDCIRYFRDERPEIKAELRKNFVLSPILIQVMWNKWKGAPPADHIARSELKIDRGLKEASARSFLAIYNKNLKFAGFKDYVKIDDVEEEVDEGGDNGETNDHKPPPPPLKGSKLMEGERVLSDGILSKTATYRVIVDGNIGVKEIDRLIKKLEMDKEILADEDEEDKVVNLIIEED